MDIKIVSVNIYAEAEGEFVENTTFDVVIAGAGFSGLLTAARLSEANPNLNILIMEKDSALGGRLRTNGAVAGRWSCGLNGVTPELYDFACKSFDLDEDGQDLPSFVNEHHETAGILSGGKFSKITFADIFESHGARKLGGMAGQRAWDKVTELLEPKDKEAPPATQAVGKLWKHTRKNPAAIVMEHYAYSFGIPDIWQANVVSLSERSSSLQKGLKTGNWEAAFLSLLNRQPMKNSIVLKTNCTIVDANKVDGLWIIETEQGTAKSKNLIVAQDPWSALQWLPKSEWSVPMLEFTLKSKPVSLVALTCEIEEYIDLPDLTFVISERVQVSIKDKKEICFRAPLDFEISLDAPEVVKAIKRLRRAKKKLVASVEGLKIGGEHLKLLPIAWPQSTAQSDYRHLKKFDKNGTASNQLAFCGDAYGSSYIGDRNIQTSILAACEHILATTETVQRSSDSMNLGSEETTKADVSIESATADTETAELETAELETAELETAELETADTETAELETAELETAELETADTETADTETADTETADTETADMKTADMKTAELETAELETAELETAELETADTETTDRETADLIEAVQPSTNEERSGAEAAGIDSPSSQITANRIRKEEIALPIDEASEVTVDS